MRSHQRRPKGLETSQGIDFEKDFADEERVRTGQVLRNDETCRTVLV